MKQTMRMMLLLPVLLVTGSLMAQAEKYQGTMYADMQPSSFEWASNRIATLDAFVNLTDAQKEQAEVITIRYAYRIDVLHRQTMDAQTLAGHKEGLFQYRMDEYRRMLTPEQVLILEANMEDLRADNLK